MKFIDIAGGAKVRYRQIDGSPDRPCLVFLHEGLGCIEMWKNFPERLCRHLHCQGLVYDRTGYGKSSRQQRKRDVSYLHEYARKELPEVLNFLIPGRNYILVGHSDGGSIALIHGAEETRLLQGMITEAAHVFVEQETVSGIRNVVEKYGKKGPRGLAKYHGDKAEWVFRSWSETWLGDGFLGWNIENLLPLITCPVLAVQGVHDLYGTGKQVEAIVSSVSGPVRSYLVPDCGHSPHLDKPDLVLEAAADFITYHCI